MNNNLIKIILFLISFFTKVSFLAHEYISFMDMEDIVYFDEQGEELEYKRVKSEIEFKTFVKTKIGEKTFYKMHDKMQKPIYEYKEAPMPTRIILKGKGDNHDYNQHDYVIAAQTYLFNLKKNKNELIPFSNKSPDPAGKYVPELLPNTVKTVVLKETRAGKIVEGSKRGNVDIMQANTNGDWSPRKAKLGFKQGGSAVSTAQSIRGGIMILYWKGLKVKTLKDENGKTTGWKTFWRGSWMTAVKLYNGGGDSRYMYKFKKHLEALERGMSDQAYREKKRLEAKKNV